MCFINEICLPLIKSRKTTTLASFGNKVFFAHSITDQVLPTAYPADSLGYAQLPRLEDFRTSDAAFGR